MNRNLTILLLAAFVHFLTASSLPAATVTVTNTNDALGGSLRQAIQDANPNDVVVFDIPTSDPGYDAQTGVYTINLTSAGFTINKTLVIYGVLNGVVAKIVVRRNAGSSFSIFTVTPGTFAIIDNLTISNGSAPTGFGGGIYNDGLLSLDDCTFSGNEASAGGGGLYNNSSAAVRNCTFTANEAPSGGAVLNAGTLMLVESTLSGNDGSDNSGGVYSSLGASTHARNTIVAGNTGSSIGPDVFGIFISDGYNFIGVGEGSTGFGNPGSHDQVGTVANPADPKLSPLGDHGGSTSTMAPLPGSLVIDQGKRETDADGVPVSDLDQRGFPRPIDHADVVDAAEGDGSDIGAVELSEFQTGPNFTVTSADDHDDAACGLEDCTLREALSAANQSADASVIVFAPGLGDTITNSLALEGLAITQPVTIIGPGARKLTISGANQNRVFNVTGGPVAIFGLTIAEGSSTSGGSGIANGGNLTLTECTISDNHGVGNLSFGGAISNLSPSSTVALLTIDGCTFSDNTVPVDSAGALYNLNGTVTITNSTFIGNSSPKAGAIGNAGFAGRTGTLTLGSCTIVGNSSTGPDGAGGGVASGNGSIVNVRNTIIAANTTPELGTDVSGPFLSQGNNLIGNPEDSTGFIDGANFDQVGVADPKIGAPGNHGGPTDTVPLLAGSAAIDQANPATVPERDQRGYIRPNTPDVGAFEFNGTIPVTLGNISTRLRVETGDNVLIGGFIVTGTEAKKVIVRALGPSLGVAGSLGNPTLELYDASGLFASNDNWKATQKAAIEATTIPPPNDLESAIVATLPANNSAYTAIVRGVDNTTGVGLVEIYDLDRTVDSKLANISSRGLVQTGDDVMIGGLIVLGPDAQRVIVRAIGPSLDVTGKLANPALELYDANGKLVASNDDWRSDQEAEVIATTIPPSKDLESAIVQTLDPAPYTAIVRGVGDTTGVALVEVFGLN